MLGGGNAQVVGPQPELVPERRLDAVAVKNLTFDFRCLQRFIADQFDLEHVPVVSTDMPDGPDELAGLQQELLLQQLQGRRFVPEFRPIRTLPIPHY